MPWIKRNLFLVVGGVVALGLLGFAGYYLFTKIQLNQEVTDRLTATTDELKKLMTRKPHPGTDQLDNIGAAKKEVQKLHSFVGEVKGLFPPPVVDGEIRVREFRSLLDQTIDYLQNSAKAAGVKLPSEDYWFTFTAQKSAMNFGTNTVMPMANQIIEIKNLCEVLYNAKIVALQGIKRSPVATEDTGYTDYMTNKPATNGFSIATPYEVTFDGFSSEFEAVLEGLIRSRTCFVVKTLAVAHAETSPVDPQMSPGMPMQPYGPGSRYGGRSRYGGGGGRDASMRERYGLPPPPAPTVPKSSKTGISSLLEEKLLRITLSLDVVKLKPQPAR
jgi:hypothetical protein